MDSRVTVIVTALDEEDRIDRCLRSVRDQTWGDLQIIVVDDGSTDETPTLVQRHAASDPRILPLRRATRTGPAAARNWALDVADGDWIAFMDADDFAEPTWIQDRLAFAVEHDVACVMGGHYVDVSGPTGTLSRAVVPSTRATVVPGSDLCVSAALLPSLGFLWNKLYRRSAIESLDLRLEPDLSLYEDLEFNLRFLRAFTPLGLVPSPGYHYVQSDRPRLTSRRRSSNLELRADLVLGMKDWVADAGLAGLLGRQLTNLAAAAVMTELARDGSSARDEVHRLRQALSERNVVQLTDLGAVGTSRGVDRVALWLLGHDHVRLARWVARARRRASASRVSVWSRR